MDGQIYTITAMVVNIITGKVSRMSPAATAKEFGTIEELFRKSDLLLDMCNPVFSCDPVPPMVS